MILRVLPDNAVDCTVFSVDDSWFEPEPGRDPTVTTLSQVLQDHRDGVTPESLLAALAARVPDDQHSDYRTATLLLRECAERQFKLVFASFEFFEQRFHSDINWQGNALMLDCNFHGEEGKGRGPILLDTLLKGRRPACDVFLLTGDSQKARETTRGLSWAVRHVPVVGKVETPRDEWEFEVRAFLDYFVAGLRVEPHVLIADYQVSLVHKGGAHPHTKDHILYDELKTWATYDGDVDVDSFKAIFTPYFYDGAARGHRTVRLGVLKTFLERVGFRVQLEPRLCAERVYLPTQPGSVFIIALLRFCRHPDLRPRGPILDVALALDANSGMASFQLPFRGFGLHASTLLGLGGEVTAVFRELLACDWSIVHKSATNAPLARDVVDSWFAKGTVRDPRDWASRLSLEPSFSGEYLTLSWHAMKQREKF